MTHEPTAISLLDRPVFIVGSPLAGGGALFDYLSQARGAWTLRPADGESGRRRVDPRSVPDRDCDRRVAGDATADVVAELRSEWHREARDRDGATADPAASVRLVVHDPRHVLRVPFLAAAFPDARFVYLYGDPRESLSRTLDAWRSGRWVSHPDLPDWPGPPWSLVLVPGWRELAGKPLVEIVARQWEIATAQLLDDLDGLPPERWCVASYDRLLADPRAEIAAVCRFVELEWDRELPERPAGSSSPAIETWRHNGQELETVMPRLAAVAQRARRLFARPPATRPARAALAEAPRPAVADGATGKESFDSVYTATFPELLRSVGSSLVVSTYQSGRIVVLRADGDRLNTHFRAFQSPMGIAVGEQVLAMGTRHHVWEYRNQPEASRRLDPPDRHDACYVPRQAQVTGDIRIHELVYSGNTLWIVNTRFSCLATLDGAHSFVPRWRPPFVSALAPEDRCHLNGVAVVDGRLRYVTALGHSDAPQGWREKKAHGGILMDFPSGEIVAEGLSMPHSPRWYQGRLWVLESGKGELGYIDLPTGKITTVSRLPGFTRGLAFAGHYAVVGLSQVRESNIFGGIPLTERLDERQCGVWIVDLRTGKTAGFVRFEGRVQEIFDIQWLPGIRYPEIAELDAPIIAGTFALSEQALREVAARKG